MSSADPPTRASAPFRACENCGTALQGGYCHLCGQSEHSPVRSFGHAVEEVFESFWHLDGRIFRTLRDLFVPGRVANRYLAGHRVCYVAPMRLFVILSLITAFAAKVTVDNSIGTLGPEPGAEVETAAGFGIDERSFRDAQTVAEVEGLRDRLLDRLARERAQIPDGVPGARAGIAAAERTVNAQAATRIAELERSARADARRAASAGGRDDGDRTAGDGAGTDAALDEDGGERAPDVHARAAEPASAISGTEPPAAAASWWETRTARMEHNLRRLNTEPIPVLRAMVGAAPLTLFILVPLFALLLKVFYLFKRRLYLEHVVVGLYSHAYLMLALLLVFVCALLVAWLEPHVGWLVRPLGWTQALLLLSMPLYLLWMQKRVYRQSWLATLFKYCTLGTIYFFLFLFVAIGTVVYALSEM